MEVEVRAAQSLTNFKSKLKNIGKLQQIYLSVDAIKYTDFAFPSLDSLSGTSHCSIFCLYYLISVQFAYFTCILFYYANHLSSNDSQPMEFQTQQ